MRIERMAVLVLVALAATLAATPSGAQTPRRESERAMREAERQMREAEKRLREAQEQLERAARRLAELKVGELGSDVRGYRFAFFGGRPRLGIVVDTRANPTVDRIGARIVAVTPGGPADEAGLQAGDIITKLDGVPLAGEADDLDLDEDESVPAARLMERLEDLEASQEVEVSYRRGGREYTTTVTARPLLGPDVRTWVDREVVLALPPAGRGEAAVLEHLDELLEVPFRWRGGWPDLELVAVNPDLGQYFGTTEGVLVVRVPRAGNLDLRAGDVILEIDGRVPRTPAQALRMLDSYEPGETVRLVVMRAKARTTLSLVVPEESSEARRVAIRRWGAEASARPSPTPHQAAPPQPPPAGREPL